MKQLYKFIPVLYFSLMTGAVHAQTATPKPKPQPVTDSAAADMCGCIQYYKDSINTRQQLFTVLQDCVQLHTVARIDALLAEDGFVQTDDRKTRADAIRAIGKKLGQRVFADCAGIKELMIKFTNDAPKKELH
jgi:hypothetical protein